MIHTQIVEIILMHSIKMGTYKVVMLVSSWKQASSIVLLFALIHKQLPSLLEEGRKVFCFKTMFGYLTL